MSEWYVPAAKIAEVLQFRKIYASAMTWLLRSEGHGQDLHRGAIDTQYAERLRLLKARKEHYVSRAVETWPSRAPHLLDVLKESPWLVAATHAKMFRQKRYRSFRDEMERLHVHLYSPEMLPSQTETRTHLVVDVRDDENQHWLSGIRIVEREIPLEKIVRVETLHPAGVKRVLEDYKLDIPITDLRIPLLFPNINKA